ncbi:MAG: hypothetical protein JWP91_803 [Fibrobacteres bacterium]|nr:hypothetical protein [Fibrobacterota bacterium]
MNRFSNTILSALPILCLAGCNLEEKAGSDPVFTCDASATVAEMCIEEPASLSTQEASKSTCLSVKGSWSDSRRCPSNYKKKCSDGDKVNYYFAKSDGGKSCGELVSLLGDPFAILEPTVRPVR